MYDIACEKMTDAFLDCFKCAVSHLECQVDGGISWLRCQTAPPFLEHLSFRLGNQLFFVRIEDVDGRINGPGSLRGLELAANMANGYTCILPMKKDPLSQIWVADMPGWGLMDIGGKNPINPITLVTDEKILMTRWEVQSMGVQWICDWLRSEGYQQGSSQSNPDVHPSIWFGREGGELEWVLVRSDRWPTSEGTWRNPKVKPPDDWNDIKAYYAKRGFPRGHFASIVLVSAYQPFRSEDEAVIPLWRGYPMHANFTGFE